MPTVRCRHRDAIQTPVQKKTGTHYEGLDPENAALSESSRDTKAQRRFTRSREGPRAPHPRRGRVTVDRERLLMGTG